jgi:uncharacterized protein with HEPN domain
MPGPSLLACLTDIVEAIELIRTDMADVSLEEFEHDKRKRWIIERGIEIISAASRQLTNDIKARHPEIPWAKIPGIGNMLRRDCEYVAHDVLWGVVNNQLPALEKACRHELALERAKDNP